MASVLLISVGTSLALGLPLAWKWQLGVRRCGAWLLGVGFAVGVTASLLGGLAGASRTLESLTAIMFTLGLSGGLVAYRFFRDPERQPPAVDGAVLSPADGEVTYVLRSKAGMLPTSTKHGRAYRLEELTQTGLRFGEAIVVGVAMSFLDVHVNRVPIGGRICLRKHVAGGFDSLRRGDALFSNERATTLIEHDGFQVAVVQIASRLVRQIVGFVNEGDRVVAGQRLGMIRFGSQVDLVIPVRDDLQIMVRPGDRVRAGESIIARLASVRAPLAAQPADHHREREDASHSQRPGVWAGGEADVAPDATRAAG